MFKKLRLRLTAVYALLAGAVLLAVCVVCLTAYERESRAAFDAAFSGAANAVIYKLQSDKSVSQQWLSQTETTDRQIVSIEDGGVKLAFRGAWSPLTPRETLIERADAKANTLGLRLPLGQLAPESVSFEIAGDAGDAYLARVALIPAAKSGVIKLIMLRDLAPEAERVADRRLITLCWAVAGLAALCLTGYVYSRRAVRPAEESFIRQAEFTAMASHELKAPLSVLTATVDALKTYPQDDEAQALLRNISSESLRMARLVDDLLILARSDAGGWHPRMAEVDMDTLLIELVERFMSAFAERNVKLSLELPDEPLPKPRGDAYRLTQILSILLDNALSYTPSGGHVVLAGRAEAGKLFLSVADDGPGIADHDKQRVFDRFYRADKAHSDPGHFGLGLSIARELARLHGGELTLKDANPHGAVFTLTLKV